MPAEAWLIATNYLERLLAEWYEYKGYFVRRNVMVGKRAKGGHECEASPRRRTLSASVKDRSSIR